MSICGFFEYQTTLPSRFLASADWQGTLEEIPSQPGHSTRIDSICDGIPSFPYIFNELRLCQAFQDIWYLDSALWASSPRFVGYHVTFLADLENALKSTGMPLQFYID
jgi:hypothetical protein